MYKISLYKNLWLYHYSFLKCFTFFKFVKKSVSPENNWSLWPSSQTTRVISLWPYLFKQLSRAATTSPWHEKRNQPDQDYDYKISVVHDHWCDSSKISKEWNKSWILLNLFFDLCKLERQQSFHKSKILNQILLASSTTPRLQCFQIFHHFSLFS